MLIPQFSLRWLLAVTTISAVVFLIFAQAVQGSGWAVGVSLAVVMLALVFGAYATLFFGVWVFSLIFSGRRSRPRSAGVEPGDLSPFALPVPASSQGREPPPKEELA